MPSTKNNTPTRKCLYALLLCAFTLLAIFYMQFSLFVVDFSLATTLFWHVQSVEIVNTPRIALIYVFDSPERLSDFTIAMSTMKCYALRHNHYSLFVLYTPQPSAEEVKAENQTDEPEHCHNCTQSDFFFRRHCFVANWMKAHPEFHWVLFMDADVGVINPNRMVEEYIQPGVELHFFDRLYNNEITAGSYLARNSKYARDFLHYWGDYFYRLPKSFHGTDNGAIHAVFMEKFANLPSNNTCQQIYDKSKNYDDLNQFTVCARHYFESQFGPNRTLDQGRLMLYPKGRGWMRDGGHTGTRFYRRDFMFHGWKQSTLDKPQKNPWTIPFNSTEKFEDPEFCSNGTAWPYKAQFFEEDEQKIEDELKRKIQLVYEERQKTLKQSPYGEYNGNPPLFNDWTQPRGGYYGGLSGYGQLPPVGCDPGWASGDRSRVHVRPGIRVKSSSKAASDEEESSRLKTSSYSGRPCPPGWPYPYSPYYPDGSPARWQGNYGPFGAGLFGLPSLMGNSDEGVSPRGWLQGLLFGGR